MTKPAENLTDPQKIAERRLWILLLLSGIFLGCLAMLNLLGISRFLVLASYDQGVLKWGEPIFSDSSWIFALAVGVLPYPLTFLCTDLISEFYGRKVANFIVLVGLLINIIIIVFLQLGAAMPGFVPNDAGGGFPAQPVFDPVKQAWPETGWTFFQLRSLAMGAVAASMVSYLLAQFIDVQLFHFWKHLTKGKHLWLRNNGSTLVSQAVDTFAVITITHFYAHALPMNDDQAVWPQLWKYIITGYAFKCAAALLDTPVIYAASWAMQKYLHLHPHAEHRMGLTIAEGKA